MAHCAGRVAIETYFCGDGDDFIRRTLRAVQMAPRRGKKMVLSEATKLDQCNATGDLRPWLRSKACRTPFNVRTVISIVIRYYLGNANLMPKLRGDRPLITSGLPGERSPARKPSS
jgi:hypothetical protein